MKALNLARNEVTFFLALIYFYGHLVPLNHLRG